MSVNVVRFEAPTPMPAPWAIEKVVPGERPSFTLAAPDGQTVEVRLPGPLTKALIEQAAHAECAEMIAAHNRLLKVYA